MKYDFFKFNRKQISKRKLEEKINITYRDYKDLLLYKLNFSICGIGLSLIILFSNVNIIIAIFGFLLGIFCLSSLLDTLNDLGCL